MTRSVMLAAMLAATMGSAGVPSVEDEALPPPPSAEKAAPAAPAAPAVQAAISFFDGSGWTPLERHDVYIKRARVAAAETAAPTFDMKPDGPETYTYVVIGGASSEVLLSTQWPRFRIASDRMVAFRIQLARFERDGQKRRTAIERVKNGVFFTRGVDLERMEVAEGLWELGPSESLPPGEYAFVVSDTEPVADFTIVEKRY